jgi:hypothetical protein
MDDGRGKSRENREKILMNSSGMIFSMGLRWTDERQENVGMESRRQHGSCVPAVLLGRYAFPAASGNLTAWSWRPVLLVYLGLHNWEYVHPRPGRDAKKRD